MKISAQELVLKMRGIPVSQATSAQLSSDWLHTEAPPPEGSLKGPVPPLLRSLSNRRKLFAELTSSQWISTRPPQVLCKQTVGVQVIALCCRRMLRGHARRSWG